jgi:membrane protein required for colicin V production
MSTADWIVIGFLAFSVAGAAIGGFFFEVFKLAGFIAGYLLAAWQYHRLAAWFAPHLKSPWLGEMIAFFVILFAVQVIAGFAGRMARWVMKKAGLSGLDRVLGGVLGLLRGVLVVAIVLTAVAAFEPAEEWLSQSELAPYFLVAGRAAIWLAPPELRQRFYRGLDYMRQAHYSSGKLEREISPPRK